MAVLTGLVGKIGAVTGAEPVGRIYLVDDNDVVTAVVNCASGPKLDTAMLARQMGQHVEIDVLATTSPFIADKVRML